MANRFAASQAQLVDLAGRQRMLNQRLVKEVLLQSSGWDADYRRTLTLLQRTAQVLGRGGVIQVAGGNEMEITSSPLPQLTGLFEKQSSVLTTLETQLRQVTEVASSDPSFRDHMKILLELSADFHGIANEAVQMLAAQTSGENKVIMKNMGQQTLNLQTSGQDMADRTGALSQGSADQAAAIEQISASINEIAGNTSQNAESAEKASSILANTETSAVAGEAKVNSMATSMSGISDAAQKISRIIKVIDEIAFQTNLLALNAAVEAARAGVHGKGFAVVAEEVRNLANRSANAAKETTGIIEDTVKKVNEGDQIAKEAIAAFNEIVQQVSNSTTLVKEIAVASQDQSRNIKEVSQGMGRINTVVIDNARAAESLTTTVQELQEMSLRLSQDLIILEGRC
jgi:methyl-accepting chemotaxis protein